MEEFLAKILASGTTQSGLGGIAVAAIIYLIREQGRLQHYVETEFREIKELIAPLSEKVILLDKKDAVFEERLNARRGNR